MKILAFLGPFASLVLAPHGAFGSTDAPQQQQQQHHVVDLSSSSSGRRHRRLQRVSFPIFMEQDGLVVMEAESVKVQFPWVWENRTMGIGTSSYTGDGYLVMSLNEFATNPTQGRLQFGVRVETPGIYRLLLHGLQNVTTGNLVHSTLVGMPQPLGGNVATTLGSGPTNLWRWGGLHRLNSDQPATYDLDAPGIYLLEITGLSRFFHFNRLVLFRVNSVGEAEATNLNVAESRRFVVENLAPPPAVPPLLDAHVDYLSLMNAGANRILPPFAVMYPGVNLDLAALPRKLNILATVGGSQTPRSVQFILNNAVIRNENAAPWAMVGDNNRGNFFDWFPTVGPYNLTVIPYSQTRARGNAGTPCTVLFTVSDSNAPPTPTVAPSTGPTFTPFLSDFQARINAIALVDADTDLPLVENLESGAILDLSTLPPNLNFVATTSGPGNPGSVQFDLNGDLRTENLFPWALFGDFAGDFKPWPNPTPGNYVLTVVPFSQGSGDGDAGTPKTITFTVVTELPPASPSASPVTTVTAQPSRSPVVVTNPPTVSPSTSPVVMVTAQPSRSPVVATNPPTVSPSDPPTEVPTVSPSTSPVVMVTARPSRSPVVATNPPTVSPSDPPTEVPTVSPSTSPVIMVTARPSRSPVVPTELPTVSPSDPPTGVPTVSPSTSPIIMVTARPSRSPVVPTELPTVSPSDPPTTSPTVSPSTSPIIMVTARPSRSPVVPTELPTVSPTVSPSDSPTVSPSTSPIIMVTARPSRSPVVPTELPTVSPSDSPTTSPTVSPSDSPTVSPSTSPVILVTAQPSRSPVVATDLPTVPPSAPPTVSPSTSPVATPQPPTTLPSVAPVAVASLPTVSPMMQQSQFCSYEGVRFINSGSTSNLLLQGNFWEMDNSYVGGGGTQMTTLNIANANGLVGVYRKNRWGQNQYTLTGLNNGMHRVVLYFAEIWSGAQAPNRRVFNVIVQNTVEFNNVDVFDAVGGFTAHTLTAVVTVTDGTLTVQLIKGLVDNPMISGIQVEEYICLSSLSPTVGPTATATRAPVPNTDSCTSTGLRFINAGKTGSSSILEGNVWEGDNSFVGGGTLKVPDNLIITNGGGLSPMYRTTRWGESDYTFDNLSNGLYRVVLHFSEIFHKTLGVNKRRFDIYIQGFLIFEEVDVFEQVGGFTAYTLTHDFVVSNGSVLISLRRGSVEMPSVSGLEVRLLENCG